MDYLRIVFEVCINEAGVVRLDSSPCFYIPCPLVLKSGVMDLLTRP